MTTTLDLDADGFNKLAGIRCIDDGAAVRFMVAGQDATILVTPAQELVTLIPERSASHRALAAALQATQTGAAAIARAGDDLATRQAARAAFAAGPDAGK